MGGFILIRLVAEALALAHAKAVLLVGNHQRQTVIAHPLAQQGVGADDQIPRSILNMGQGFPALRCLHAAQQQPAADAQWLQYLTRADQMLPGQNLGRRHQRALPAGRSRRANRAKGNSRLAAAHIALHQPAHGASGRHIRQNLPQHALLGTGGCEACLPPESVDDTFVRRNGDALLCLPLQRAQRHLIQQQVFKGDAALARR